MVKLFYVVLLSLSSTVSTTQPPQWQADYGKALAATRSDDRPLLVVLDVPNDPKASVKEKQLETKGQQAKLLANYQLCHVDVSTNYGKKVAKVFKAETFPFTAIIDKTGSVVLCKKAGTISEDEWEKTLTTYRKGESASASYHTSAYRGTSTSIFGQEANSSVINPSYCPSCQRNAQQSF